MNSVLKELAQRFSIKLKATAPYSAWQNGQNEGVQSGVDRCLEKVMEEHPKTDPKFALSQAI